MTRWLTRYYAWCSLGILVLAAFNVSFRLGRESVGEWDESLYATSAWEMTTSRDLIGTTSEGTLDYYNSKPPLNVWLIAGAFSAFGINLVTLRMFSAAFGWLTVWVLQRWTKDAFGPVVSLTSSLVLASAFGFLHQHAARSGNPDALLTLLILLVVVILWHGREWPWQCVWLGPVLAGVFLLKGMAVLQPLLLIAIMEGLVQRRERSASRRLPFAAAVALFSAPVGAWLILRWRLDGWQFLSQMVTYDLLGTAFTRLEEHDHGPLFYVGVLQRLQYEWLGAGVVACFIATRSGSNWVRDSILALRNREPLAVLVFAWALATFAVPTVMQTRIAWYLNPFYPLFATLVGILLARGLDERITMSRTRTRAVAVTLAAALVVAQSKSLWRLYQVTNLDTSVQGLLLNHLRDGQGQRVYRDHRLRSEAFVVRGLRHAEFHVVEGAAERPRQARQGDLVVIVGEVEAAGLRLLGRADGHSVYQIE